MSANVLPLLTDCPSCKGRGRPEMTVGGHTLYGPKCRFCRGNGKVPPKKAADFERGLREAFAGWPRRQR